MKQKSPGESLILLATYVMVILSTGVIIAYTPETATQAITIQGKVKEPKEFKFSDLQKFQSHNIGDVEITNHKGDVKGTASNMKGVLFVDILEQVFLDTENPKLFSEYYFVCKATDGYKVVFSWNELFNTVTGKSVYIILEKDKKEMAGSDDNILMISSQDIHTGRRYVKNLETIEVARAE